MDSGSSPSATRIVVRQSCGYDAPIRGIAMAGWNRLISIGDDNKLRLHNPETGRTLDSFEGFRRHVTAIRALDDRYVLLILGTHHALLDLDTGRLNEPESADAGRSELAALLTPAQLIAAPMLAPTTFAPPRDNAIVAEAKLDATHIVYVSENRQRVSFDQYFHVWNVPLAREIRSFWGVDSEALSLVALEGRRVLSSHEDELFRVWDVETTGQLSRIEHRCGKAGPMMLVGKSELLFAPVGPTEAQRLRYWHWKPSDRTLRLWDLEASTELAVLQCEAPIIELARIDSHRFWARDERSWLHLIEVLR